MKIVGFVSERFRNLSLSGSHAAPGAVLQPLRERFFKQITPHKSLAHLALFPLLCIEKTLLTKDGSTKP